MYICVKFVVIILSTISILTYIILYGVGSRQYIVLNRLRKMALQVCQIPGF